MIGALSPQLTLPLESSQPVYTTGPGQCCSAPYCSGCTFSNFLSTSDSDLMRRHLARLLARQADRS
jgi:hypothetical protein